MAVGGEDEGEVQECIMKVLHVVLLSFIFDHLVVSYSVMLRLTRGFGRERPDPSLMKLTYDLSSNGFILYCILQYTLHRTKLRFLEESSLIN